MKWIEMTEEQRRRGLRLISPLIPALDPDSEDRQIVSAAYDFLKASTEEPFAEQIRADMAVLQRLYDAWKATPSEDTWRAALSACIPLHYMIRSTHPDRKTFEAIREVLTESRPK